MVTLFLVLGSRTLHQIHKNKKYWKWRPIEKVNGNGTVWWHYAITCHLDEIHSKNESKRWQVVLKKARENLKYFKAFKSYLENPVTLDVDLRVEKESLDHSRTYEELKALREIALFHLRKEKGFDSAPKVDMTLKRTQSQETSKTFFYNFTIFMPVVLLEVKQFLGTTYIEVSHEKVLIIKGDGIICLNFLEVLHKYEF